MSTVDRFYLFCQFYNPRTDCLEGSAEVLRVNRHSSGNQFVYHRGKKEKELVKASSKIGAPVVEHVAFSRDGEVIINDVAWFGEFWSRILTRVGGREQKTPGGENFKKFESIVLRYQGYYMSVRAIFSLCPPPPRAIL